VSRVGNLTAAEPEPDVLAAAAAGDRTAFGGT
jgi:hypothetical protein